MSKYDPNHSLVKERTAFVPKQHLPPVAQDCLDLAKFIIADIPNPHPFAPNSVLEARELATRAGELITHDPNCLVDDSAYMKALQFREQLTKLTERILSSNPAEVKQFKFDPEKNEIDLKVPREELIKLIRSPENAGITICRTDPPGYNRSADGEGYGDEYSISFLKKYDPSSRSSFIRVTISEIIDAGSFDDAQVLAHTTGLKTKLAEHGVHLHILPPDKEIGDGQTRSNRTQIAQDISKETGIDVNHIMVADHHLHEWGDDQSQ